MTIPLTIFCYNNDTNQEPKQLLGVLKPSQLEIMGTYASNARLRGNLFGLPSDKLLKAFCCKSINLYLKNFNGIEPNEK